MERCPDCDGPVHEELVTQKFPYGYEGYEHKAILTATYIALVCDNRECDCVTSDERGEAAREAAVDKHLRRCADATSLHLVEEE